MLTEKIKCDDRVVILAGKYSSCIGTVFATTTDLGTGILEDVMVQLDELNIEDSFLIKNVRKLN